ncbi:hypothetical protein ACFWY6_37555 [Streptomyces sp. NPDC059037]|uniref:hypothetical protein n=1 Tax=Streptomyces sp. NPDC059037 TaxID=3346710 RepID=UPI003680FBC5
MVAQRTSNQVQLLGNCLADHKGRWAGEDTLSMDAAAREMPAWTKDKRRYVRAHHHAAWESAIEDLQQCIKECGTDLANFLSAETTVLITSLQECLSDPDDPKREPLHHQLSDLLEKITETGALLACWQDLVRACGKSDYSMSRITKTRDASWGVAHHSGHNTRELQGILSGVLIDDLNEKYRALTLLGESTAGMPQSIQERINRKAGMSDTDRKALCQRIVSSPPRVANHVVWLIYDSAQINGDVVEIGPVEFHHGPTLRRRFNEGNTAEISDELTGYRNQKYWPEDSNFVLARVNLGSLATSDAPGAARKQAMAVLLTASLDTGGKGKAWRDTGSHIHTMDGSVVSEKFFRTSATPATSFDLSSLAYGIDNAAGTLSPHLPLVDESLNDLLQALNVWDQAKNLDGTSAILLNVRTIELVSSYDAGLDWFHFCNRRFRANWIRNEMLLNLRRGLYDATLFNESLTGESRDRVRQMMETVFQGENGSAHCDDKAGLSVLNQVASEYSGNDLVGYRLNSLAKQYSSAHQLSAYRRTLNARWEHALRRIQRARNALTHGGPVTEDISGSVSVFSRKLAGRALGYSLRAMIEGKEISQAMDDAEALGSGWEVDTLSAKSATGFLFGS